MYTALAIVLSLVLATVFGGAMGIIAGHDEALTGGFAGFSAMGIYWLVANRPR